MAIHLVYPHKNKTSAPNIIGWKLLNALSEIDEVIPHDFHKFYAIKPKDGDILIGHPHPFEYTVMNLSMKNQGWKRKIILQPYNGNVEYVGYIDNCIDNADSFLAITGKYWFNEIPNSIFARWYPKMKHLDLAVDIKAFEKIKIHFNEQSKRKFVYIGNDISVKNVDYLEEIAKKLPNYEFHTIGNIKKRSYLINHGYLDLNSKEARNLLREFDFMITVGSWDANPTTILESIAWGLIPICTPTSGYNSCPGIINIPLNNTKKAIDIINNLQDLSCHELNKIQYAGYNTLIEYYNWDRFCEQVKEEILSKNNYTLFEKHEKIQYSRGIWLDRTIKALIKNLIS
jgi:glycosyltransferase involved in cell wall biosynthesis